MARILLAEDDTSMREYLQRALQRVGYEVEAVGCGTEAVPLLETTHFDLLLTDIVMPEMDGIELAQKASAIDPAIRVMFITGFAAVALQGGRTAPEAKLLSKPHRLTGWACSSVVEHCVDIAGVASSILATPTISPLESVPYRGCCLNHLVSTYLVPRRTFMP